jgi:Fe-S-cluster-containing hydrogenase component 2
MKLCDKSAACPAAQACPHKAFNTEREHFDIQREKCSGCCICQDFCDLIQIIRNEYDLEQFKLDISNDPRNEQTLRVERFSAEVVDPAWYECKLDALEAYIESQDSDVVIEFVNPENVVCLYQTIPIAEIIGETPYKKVNIYPKSFALAQDEWRIDMLPTVVIFRDNVEIGRIQGRILVANEEERVLRVSSLIDQFKRITIQGERQQHGC